jgi:hypothetical protein
MIENYNGLVSQHAGGGSWSTGALGDGTLRHGAERAIITNIHGLWSQGQGSMNDFRNYPAAPEQSRSMMWLGVITAMMFNSLTFQSTFGWGAPTVPGGGWLQEIQQEIWAAQVEQLMPSFTAPFGTVQHPLASVTSAKCLRPSAHAVINECADPIRGRAWRELCNQTRELCVHVIVVNIALDSPVQFQVTIDGLGLTAATNATRLFDAAYNTTVSQQGALEDYAGPGESLIYEIGCHESAPKQLSTPTFPDVNDGRPSGVAGLSPWKRCMNRRVLCKDGFMRKSPFNATCQPPGPAAAVHTTLKTDDGALATPTTSVGTPLNTGLFGDQNTSVAVSSGTLQQQSDCILGKLNAYYECASSMAVNLPIHHHTAHSPFRPLKAATVRVLTSLHAIAMPGAIADPDVAGIVVPWHWSNLSIHPHTELGVECFPEVSRLHDMTNAGTSSG